MARGSVQSKVDWYNDIIGCALDHLVGEAGGPAWTAAAFDRLAESARSGFDDTLAIVAQRATRLLGRSVDIGNTLEQLSAAPFADAVNDVQEQLSRLMSMPAGAEATGLGVVDDLNGWTYITSNFQHPGDWGTPLHNVVKATLDPLVRANYKDRFGAQVGYLTGAVTSVNLAKKTV